MTDPSSLLTNATALSSASSARPIAGEPSTSHATTQAALWFAAEGVGAAGAVSTSAVALPLPEADAPGGGEPGWIVDTPGVRSFGIAHVDPANVLHGFPELVDATANCPPNCDHLGEAGNCGLDGLVAAGGADAGRVASFRRLLLSRSGLATSD